MANFRPLILDRCLATGWGPRKGKSFKYVISRKLFRSHPLNLCIVVPYDEMHEFTVTYLATPGIMPHPALPLSFHQKPNISETIHPHHKTIYIIFHYDYMYSMTHTLCPSGVTLFQLNFLQNACVWMRMALGEGICVILTHFLFFFFFFSFLLFFF